MKLSEKNKNFFTDVYEVARLIPEGRATSYGAIAKYLGAVRGARMVGWAMNGAHSIPDVPAHRVVNRNGDLSGRMHFATPTEMEELLAEEGGRQEIVQLWVNTPANKKMLPPSYYHLPKNSIPIFYARVCIKIGKIVSVWNFSVRQACYKFF